jgi:hypothetical protein
MKTKRVVLGLLAFTMAIGSAFTFQGSPRPAHVSVLFFGSGAYQCINTGLQCSNYGPVTCRVDVITLLGNTTVVAKRDAACVTTLSENTNLPIGVYISSYGMILAAQ